MDLTNVCEPIVRRLNPLPSTLILFIATLMSSSETGSAIEPRLRRTYLTHNLRSKKEYEFERALRVQQCPSNLHSLNELLDKLQRFGQRVRNRSCQFQAAQSSSPNPWSC